MPWEDELTRSRSGGGGRWEDEDAGPISNRQAFASNFADSLTLGFGDELVGGVEGARAMLRGADAGDAYRQRVRQARERLRRAREERPLASTAGSLAGGVAALAVPGANVLAAGRAGRAGYQAARGLRALRNEIGNAARAGALFGGAYGVGSGDGDLGQRAMSGAAGAATGAVAGAAFAPVARGLDVATRPVRRAIGQAMRNPPGPRLASPNQLNASIGVPIPPAGGRRPPTQPPPEPEVPEAAVRGIDRVMRREGMSFDDLAQRINEADAAPAGRVLADVLGDQGLAKTAAIAQAPGQTGRLARNVADERARTLPTRLVNELMERMGVSQSPTQALRSLRNEYQRASLEGYKPVLAQEIDEAAVKARLDPILQRLPERIRNEANQIVDDLARLDGVDPNTFTNAQRLHYLKMAIDDAVGAVIQKEGFKGATRGALSRLRQDYLEALDELIPGYRAARERWGSLKDAEEALEEGGRALSMRPEALRARLDEMTAFERAHFRIGLADELAGRIMGRGKAVGHANAAEALNSVEVQNVVREAFDNPEQAARFIESVNTGNQLLRNARGWITGSDTMKKSAQLADEGLASIADTALSAVQNPISTARRGVQEALRAAVGGKMEADRNAIGRALLTAIDNGDEQAEAYLRALIERLRRRDAERVERVASEGRAGAAGAIGGGSSLEEMRDMFGL